MGCNQNVIVLETSVEDFDVANRFSEGNYRAEMILELIFNLADYQVDR